VILKPLDKQYEWAWLQNLCKAIQCEDSQGIIALDGGKIVAGAVFDSFGPDACNVHWAIAKPMVLRHGFIEAICHHLFITCDRKRIFGLVPSTNERALKLDKHIGMTEVARIPHAMGEGVDYIVLTMTKADCLWLPEELREAA
jgi:RimJ/RimL family protein N-acetyltransferase